MSARTRRLDQGRKESPGPRSAATSPAAPPADSAADMRSPEQMVRDFFARSPQRSPSDLVALARAQGMRPVTSFEDLLGKGPAEGDEFDVDAFLAVRKEWQAEERLLTTRLVEPDDAAQ